MSTAFCIVNIITESQNIFVEFIDILEGSFHGNAFAFPFKINDITDRLRGLVHILDESDDSIRLMVFHMVCYVFSFIFKNNGK